MKIKFFLTPCLCILCLLFCSNNAFSQVTEIQVIDSTSQKKPKLKFGVGFGLSFVGGTNVSLSPNLTYLVSDKVSVGGGLQGSYTSIKDLQSTITVGGNVIGSYSPIRQITTLLEFAELNVTSKRETPERETPEGEIKNNFWESALFVGAGYNITEKISVGAKYNVLFKEDESVYSSPVLPFVNISF
jgi:long-subunit fatty acid transport protein